MERALVFLEKPHQVSDKDLAAKVGAYTCNIVAVHDALPAAIALRWQLRQSLVGIMRMNVSSCAGALLQSTVQSSGWNMVCWQRVVQTFLLVEEC